MSRIAIVTGAGQGIGRAIAEKLAAGGDTVMVTDINETTAKETAAAIGGDALAIRTDVTAPESVRATVDQVRDQFGRIDVLVNNAGWLRSGRFVESDPADWDRIIAINLYGVLTMSRAVLPVMAGQSSGTVVNVASDAARVGGYGEAVYAAANAGVIAFTKSVAREMARHQVTVNSVCPGPTETALFDSVVGDNLKWREALTRSIPMRRLGRPGEVADAVTFLASADAAYITGQTISVSGGLTMN